MTAVHPTAPNRLEFISPTSTEPIEEAPHEGSMDEWLRWEYELGTQSPSEPLNLVLIRHGTFRFVVEVVASVPERLERLKRDSGLTWEQVARLFGVSKRAVLHWRAGNRMSAVHEERLATLLTRVAELIPERQGDARARLLALDADGTAPYQRWLDEVRRLDPDRAWIDR